MDASELLLVLTSQWRSILLSLVQLFLIIFTKHLLIYDGDSQAILALGRQILLHPLRKYPGPFLAKFTDGYLGYQAVRRRLHLATYDSHARYGIAPFVRVQC